MNLPRIMIVTCFAAGLWVAGAAPESGVGGGLGLESQAKVKGLERWIAELADEKFQVREAASFAIWQLGSGALSALSDAASGADPERAYRARELIRKIELEVTPETDGEVIAMVERYATAVADEKVELMNALRQKRAWRQILKLYAGETDEGLLTRLQRSVRGVSLIAAREALIQGDAKRARDFLEMAPADEAGLLALADFHRSQGTLVDELARAKQRPGAHAQTWQLALQRAAGDVKAARALAGALGNLKLEALMAALDGDPLPWLRVHAEGEGEAGDVVVKIYNRLATRRWQGKPLQASDLAPLERAAASKSRSQRGRAISGLFVLGEVDLAEKAYAKASPSAAFAHFESLERIPEALSAWGLDPEKPDYAAWVAKRLASALAGDADDFDASMDIPDLVQMANFLERRGLHALAAEAFEKPLLALAEEDTKFFKDFIALLFGDAESVGNAPQLAQRVAVAWAGDDAARWDDVMIAAFGGNEQAQAWVELLAELAPEAGRVERLEAMLALFRVAPDPRSLRDKWLSRVWEAFAKMPADERKSWMEPLMFLAGQAGDVETNLRIWDELPKSEKGWVFWRSRIGDLSAAERWDDAAAFFLEQIERSNKRQQEPLPSLYACAAACLRQTGREREAVNFDRLADQLALGNDAVEIASAYAYGYDYKRAAVWWARAARLQDPEADELAGVLSLHLETLLEQGEWRTVAALAEVIAQRVATTGMQGEAQSLRLKLRLQSDLGRALAGLKQDRAASLAILENCRKMSPSDGFMADYFFPAVRRSGLLDAHDRWFKESWDGLLAVIARYPGSDNTYNTAGWLASRARRNLAEAEKLQESALAMHPNQAAYLDTMAEIQFAMGKRAKAVEWSRRAINYRPDDAMLRVQYHRFAKAPLER
ncbi:MAG: hypothetical protein RLZZ245_1221 [Verrucomicrobiota bacterium]